MAEKGCFMDQSGVPAVKSRKQHPVMKYPKYIRWWWFRFAKQNDEAWCQRSENLLAIKLAGGYSFILNMQPTSMHTFYTPRSYYQHKVLAKV